MHETSSTYKAIAAAPHDTEVKAVIDGVEYGIESMVAASISAKVFGYEAPSVGNCVSRTLNMEILAPQTEIKENAEIAFYARIVNDTAASEWLKKGVFYVNTRSKNLTDDGTEISTVIKAFDAFTKAKVKFAETFAFPAKDKNVVAEVAKTMGVKMKCKLSQGYTIEVPSDDLTQKDALAYIAGMYAGSFVITDDGALDLIPLAKGTPTELTAGSVSKGDKLTAITQVIAHKMDGTEYTAGTGTGRVLHVDTPWATQAVADYVLSCVSGYEYQTYSAQDALADPALELGDTITIGGATEAVYRHDVTFTPGIVSYIAAPPAKEADHQYLPNKTRGGGKLAAKVEEVEKTAVQVKSGLDQIATYDPESGYAVAEAALFATILDESQSPPQIKTSRISAAVVRDVNGNLKSLAYILADVIELTGRVNLTGSLYISDGNLYCENNYAVFKGLIATYVDFSRATSIRVGDYTFSPHTVTLADGTTMTVLGSTHAPVPASEEEALKEEGEQQ